MSKASEYAKAIQAATEKSEHHWINDTQNQEAGITDGGDLVIVDSEDKPPREIVISADDVPALVKWLKDTFED